MHSIDFDLSIISLRYWQSGVFFTRKYICKYALISVADPGILEPGSAVPAWYNFGGLEIVLMPLYTIPYDFVVRVENKIHIVNSACWLCTIKFMRVFKIQTNWIRLCICEERTTTLHRRLIILIMLYAR